MGLDISVIKPCPPEQADENSYDDTGKCHSSNPKLLRSFPQFVQEIPEEVFDYGALGHPEYEDDSFWTDPENPRGFVEIEDTLYLNVTSLSDEQDHGESIYGTWSSEESFCSFSGLTIEELKAHTETVIKLSDIPVKTVKTKTVFYKEVGYQRKGANTKFYEDGKWEDPEKICVVTQEELESDWWNYFSRRSPESGGDGFGSAVEYDLTDQEMSERFKENIMRVFKEGETAVMYW